MSCSFVVRAQVGGRGGGGGGRDLGGKKRIKEKSKHTLQYVLCVLNVFFFVFFLQGAVLAAAFVRCKVRSPHIQYLSLSLVHTYYIHITFKTNTPPPHPTPQHNTSTLVLLDTMQCNQYTICVYLTSHLITLQTLQHKAKKVSN